MKQALARAGSSIGQVEPMAIHEAFAAIALVCLRELAFAQDIVNVEGSAIAHGHRIDATGRFWPRA